MFRIIQFIVSALVNLLCFQFQDSFIHPFAETLFMSISFNRVK